MKKKIPIVSVNIPVYNCGCYLAEAIESILNQTFQDFELIICNDGSTDNSLDIIHEYAKTDDRVIVISTENHGIVASRNRMIAASSGKYIAVLDCDDVALPQRLALQVEYLLQHPEVVCVGCDVNMIDEKGRYLTTLSYLRGNEKINEAAMKGHCSIIQSGAMIRACQLKSIGGYALEATLAEDLDLWLRLGELGKLENIAVPLVNYRLHKASASQAKAVEQRAVAKLACERAANRRGVTSQFEAYEMWRPTRDAKSIHKFMLQYGWWAWNSAQRKTAVIYALHAIYAKFFSRPAWSLLLCALLKPLPRNKKVKG